MAMFLLGIITGVVLVFLLIALMAGKGKGE